MKLCPHCGTEKTLDSFTKKGTDKYQSYCKPCARIKTNEWRRAKYSPERKREADLKHKYGITTDDYNQMFADQKGCCAICLEHQSTFKRKLAVDHCHTTGKVRGLLCDNCNTAIGKLNDDLERIARAASYIRTQG